MSRYYEDRTTVLIGNTDFIVEYAISDDEILIASVQTRDHGSPSFGHSLDISTIGCLAVKINGEWVGLYDYLVSMVPVGRVDLLAAE